MTWAEKVVSLPPLAVTAAYFSITIPGSIWSVLAQTDPASLSAATAFLVLGFMALILIFGWTRALHLVATSRGVSEPKDRQIFGGFLFSGVIWLLLTAALPRAPDEYFYVVLAVALITSVFYFSATWITAQTLLRFERSDDQVRTFGYIFVFPVGVWFLRPRLLKLLSAPIQVQQSLP